MTTRCIIVNRMDVGGNKPWDRDERHSTLLQHTYYIGGAGNEPGVLDSSEARAGLAPPFSSPTPQIRKEGRNQIPPPN
jgi:hypothetical protein